MQAAAPGDVIEERFRLLAPLGAGAMGSVFRARDLSSGRDVALKLILDGERRPDRQERFRREGQLAAALEHPGIVRVHSLGERAGQPYLVYELVDGARPLGEALLERDRAGRLELIRQVAEALGHAHARGVVHRDLKPDNVLVTPEGQARVTDFGLALGRGLDRLTQTGGTVGTPYFMAPEQGLAERDLIGPPTDVWALGVILYSALTDTPPWPGPSLQEVASQIIAARPKPPRKLDPTISPALEAVALQALAQDPAKRFADGAAFAEALVAAQRDRRRSGPLLLLMAAAAAAAVAALLASLRGPLGPAPAAPPAPALATAAPEAPPPQPTVSPAPRPAGPLLRLKVPRVHRAFFLSARWIFVTSEDHAELYDLQTGRPQARYPVVTSQGVALDGERLLLGIGDGGLGAYDLHGRRLRRSHYAGHIDAVCQQAGLPVAVTIRSPPGLLLVNPETLIPQRRTALSGPTRFLRRVGEGHLLVATPGGELMRYGPRGKPLAHARFNGPPFSLALTPDQRQVLLGDGTGCVYVYTLPELQLRGLLRGKHAVSLAQRFGATTAHLGRVEGIAVSADGRTAWTVSGGGAPVQHDLRVWDLETLEQVGTHLRTDGHYGSLDADPTRTRLVFTRRDSGVVEVWPTRALGRN